MEIGPPPPAAAGNIDYLSRHLPFEIQLHILRKLDFVEFSRFNAVCKAWRSIASAARKNPLFLLQHQQVPWVIYEHELPKLFGLHDSYSCSICGSSSDGYWLLLRQSSTPFNNIYTNYTSFLLNPITGQRITLRQNPKAILDRGVILPADQSVVKGGDGITVVAYFRSRDSFYQWRSQDERWTKIHGCSRLPILDIIDMIYHKGNIYAINHHATNCIFIINMSSQRPYCCWLTARSTEIFDGYIGRPMLHNYNLVECDGDLLMVMRSRSLEKCQTTVEVGVFKYNPVHGHEIIQERVESIGEKYALLVGNGKSIAIDVSCTNSTSFRANCVYFFDDEGILSFNLGNKRLEILVPHTWFPYKYDLYDAQYLLTWFMPGLT